MADVAQYTISLKEVTLALVKAQHLKEGNWVVGFEFGFGAGNAGQTPMDVKPTMITTINNFTLLRVRDGEPIPPFAVDAAKLE